MGLLTTKFQLLKIPRKRKLAIMSETVRDRAKRSQFSNPVGLLHTKLQLLKISILGHMISQGHMTLEM